MATLESDPTDIVEDASDIEMEDLPAEEWINDQEMEQEAGPVVWKDKPISVQALSVHRTTFTEQRKG